MKYKLRSYQQQAVDIAVAKLKGAADKPFIIQAATGSGKSIIIADICHKLDEPVLILQPSKELLVQNYEKLESYGVDDISIYSASVGKKEIGKYCYATIGSIFKKPELFKKFKYILIDECDVLNPKEMETMYRKFFTAIDCKNICGLTATPYRLQQKYVNENNNIYYTSTLKVITRIGYPTFWSGGIAYKIETKELIDQGYLCPIEYFVETPDTRDLMVNSTGADFTVESLERFGMKRVARICQAIQYAKDRHERVLVFCSSIRQANAVLDAFSADLSGFSFVNGKTPTKERNEAVRAYKCGEKQVMLNVGVFLAGFDVPELDSIIFARPTLSLRIWYQAIGRGVRLDPAKINKVLYVYDLVGITNQMGRVENIRLRVESGGFRNEVWGDVGRMDEYPVSKFFVKNKPKHLKGK